MSKASKKRQCPAVGREITPAECGENRGSRYACPAECPHNPFAPANYERFLEVEGEVDRKSLEWLLRDAADRAALEREIQQATHAKTRHALYALLAWRILFQTDAAGLTCAQRWQRAGFPGLKNDERVVVQARMQTRIILLEVHRVLDDQRTEGIDLLEANPTPFVVQDRGLASSAVRFASGLSWCYALPHFRRLCGTAIILAEVPPFEPAEVTTEIVRHLGGPADEPGMRRWLAGNFVRFSDALTAVGLERRRLMFANLDGKFGKAVYELQRPFAECRGVLDAIAEVAEDPLADGERAEGFAEARVWFADRGESVHVLPEGGGPVLGRVLLGQAHWRLEAIGEARLATLRERFERAMGGAVRFTGERLDNLGAVLAAKEPRVDTALVPPRLVACPQRVDVSSMRVPKPVVAKSETEIEEDFFAAQDRAWLDRPVPALDDKTPREAARDPALRPMLIRLMKSRIRSCDQRNLATGSNQDVNWMLRELGLDEILFDPPPPRAPREAPGAADEEDDEIDDDRAEAAARATLARAKLPPPPPLPDRPFNQAEVQARLDLGLRGFKTAAEAVESLEASGSTLVSDVDDLTADTLDDDAFACLVPLLAALSYVFAPPGTRSPQTDCSALQEGLIRELEAVLRAVKGGSPGALEGYLTDSPQPSLVQAVAGQLLTLTSGLPKKARPDADSEVVMLAVLKAAIAELDAASRAG